MLAFRDEEREMKNLQINGATQGTTGPVDAAETVGEGSGQVHVRVAVIGTGFTGLAAVHALSEAGIEDFVVLERAGEVGGTWRDNSYPGLACDVPSHLYSLSFAPNPEWTRTFASGPEICDYMRKVARTLRMEEVTRFGEELLDASWDQPAQRWRIRTTTLELTAEAIIDGSGPLSEPTRPAIAGLERFAGKIFHSARWDHEHDLAGQRVAVIGTGASAIQIVPAIQPKAGALTVFQRTPGWVMPRLDRTISKTERGLLRAFPALGRVPRWLQYLARDGVMHQLMHRRWMRKLAQGIARAFLRLSVKDPGLRAKLKPDFQIGCKRILITNQWYPALSQPNVTVETSPIREIGEHAVITADGIEHEVDAVVLATGFHSTDPPIAKRLHGRDGRSLTETWGDSPRAYKGVTTANFPNLFRIGSIGTGTGHISHIVQIESGVRYAVRALLTTQERGLASVEITEAAQTEYARRVHERFRDTVWVTGGCDSWYLDKSGEPSVNWPSTASRYRNWTRRFDIENYHATPAPATPPASDRQRVPDQTGSTTLAAPSAATA
jgi:cation diffusion facilitator CzcD-associated flavoprotein CzcO